MKTVTKLSGSEPVAIRGGRYLDCYTAPEKFSLLLAIGIILLCSVNPLRAGENVTDKDPPVKKSPSFEAADNNADHVVTKDELKGYPFLLEYFDRVIPFYWSTLIGLTLARMANLNSSNMKI